MIMLKPPWSTLFTKALRGLFLLAVTLSLTVLAGMEVHAEEPAPEEGWLNDFEYSLDGTAGTITLKKYTGTKEILVIPGSVELEGVTYGTVLQKFLFLYADKSMLKNIQIASGVTFPADSEGLFKNLTALESLTFGEDLDTSNVTKMSGLFYGCSALQSLDLHMWDTENVTAMDFLLQDCAALEDLNLTGWSTSNVTTMKYMFFDCRLIKAMDLSTLDTGNVKTFQGMFSGCYALKELNLTGIDTHSAESFASFLVRCDSLEEVDVSSLNTSNVTNFSSMFSAMLSLKKLDVSMLDVSKGEDFSDMFARDKVLEELNLTGWHMENAKDISRMFQEDSKLKAVDLSGFHTDQVTTMNAMFWLCKALEAPDFSSFNTANVTTMQNMFYQCSSMKKLDLSSFSTAAVTDYSSMFAYDTALNELDLSGFDLSAATKTDGMLRNVKNLRKLVTPKIMGTHSIPLNNWFYEKDAFGNFLMDTHYTAMEEAPASTPIYRFIGYTVVFCEDETDTVKVEQKIETGVATPLRLNTFEKEGSVFQGWSRDPNAYTPTYSDGQVVTNLVSSNAYIYLYPVWSGTRRFTFTIPASAQLTMLEDGALGAEIPYSIVYTGRNADCVRIQASAGYMRDAFDHELQLNCWNTRPTWFVMEDGGGTLNESTGFYEGTGVITVSVNSAWLNGVEAGLYRGNLTVTVGYL